MSALMLGNVPVVGWMLYTIVISGVVTLAALAAHDAQRASNRAVRWVWLAAVASIITLGAAAPFRDRAVVASDGDAGIASPERGELAIAGTGEGARYWVVRVRDALSAPLRLTLQRTQSLTGPIPSPVHQAVTLLWFGASAAMALVFLTTWHRVVRGVRRLPREQIAGMRVRIAPRTGPAVVGLVLPEIVVPAWLKSRPLHEQRMALIHEWEHIRAADQWLLVAACGAVALMPWNPALWYALARLRLAVEIDCDCRVLRGGIPADNYGNLLIELSALRRSLPAMMPAFPGTASHLERRLLAMTERSVRFRFSRRIAGVLVAATILITACESRLPTSAEIEEMDVASVERQARTVGVLDSMRVRYIVDGVAVEADAARELSAARIASVDVSKGQQGGWDEVRIVTRRPLLRDSSLGQEVEERAKYRNNEAGTKTTFEGLLIIDDVVVSTTELKNLARDRIESIDVLKGAAATGRYSDPRAVHGVIRVTMKR
jgi:beta-lactamase regulating signal transducer with metallopeptidase domain